MTAFRRIVLLLIALLAACEQRETVTIDRATYHDRLHGFWLGACIANWTGLTTENIRFEPPFFTDEDWQTPAGHYDVVIDLVLEQDPWKADDDTDIEYVYQHALESIDGIVLTSEEISREWRDHIGMPYLWVSNLAAVTQMQNGALPPDTSLPGNNPKWDMIDAQLTTELFGALAPGRPDIALEMAHLPIRTTAYRHSEWAAEFYVIMHSLAAIVDPELSRKQQVMWLAEQARQRIPDSSYIADMYDFVKAEYDAIDDKNDWESVRDKVYERYQLGSTAGYRYQYPFDAGINFASSIVSLLFGEGDFKRTIRIGTLTGWDSDNPTATWGGLLGLMYGREELLRLIGADDISNDYWIERTRANLPVATDNFSAMAERGLEIVDRFVRLGARGEVRTDKWIIPLSGQPIQKAVDSGDFGQWTTIEDDDERWELQGFETRNQVWKASNQTLTTGTTDCRASIRLSGTDVLYFAYRDAESGAVRISLDNVDLGEFSLAGPEPQYYVKVFEARDLDEGDHILEISCIDSEAPKSIDLLYVMDPGAR